MNNLDSINPKKFPPSPQVVNLLAPSTGKKSTKVFKFILKLIILCILALTVVVGARAVNLSEKIFVGKKLSFFQRIGSIFGSSHTKLLGEDLSQINILLLGVGGEGHDGPYLTDTMILAQIRPDNGKVALTSIPRDYYTTLPKNAGMAKINAAFSEGYFRNNKSFSEAGNWAISSVEKISGLKIPYFAVIDFSGFKKAIDQINGVDVTVDREFTDAQFPNDSLGYLKPVTFKVGKQTMNGETALIFARSRHGNNNEGSDYARSQRQQKVISAFKQKILALNSVKDANTLNKLLGLFAEHFHTNLEPNEILRLYSLVKDNNINQFLSTSLDPETHIICPGTIEETGAWVLMPCEGKTTKDIENFFKNAFALGKLAEEKSVVWLASSTGDKVEYQKAWNKLSEAGFSVWELSYSKDLLEKSVVYQVNSKPGSTEYIKNTLGATEVTLPPPGVKLDKDRVDIIVILGKTKN
jgi:polyisoprenyl-teichoic acid--peptidoglycan teichoic acid transferase